MCNVCARHGNTNERTVAAVAITTGMRALENKMLRKLKGKGKGTFAF